MKFKKLNFIKNNFCKQLYCMLYIAEKFKNVGLTYVRFCAVLYTVTISGDIVSLCTIFYDVTSIPTASGIW